jgi:hypothetical protein
MIRAKLPLDSIVAPEACRSEFFNSLGYKRTSKARISMSAYMSQMMSRRFWQALHRSLGFGASCFERVLRRVPCLVRGSHQLISGSSDPACHNAACMDHREAEGRG